MDVTKVNQLNATMHCGEVSRMTDEELVREYNYHMAMKKAEKLREMGLISDKEFAELKAKFLRYFSPFLAELS